MFTALGIEQYQTNGFFIARNLFSPEEVARLRAHYMGLREGQEHPGDFAGVPVQRIWGDSAKTGDLLFADKPDPLKQYPRMIHMHRWDENSLNWLLDERLNEHLTALLGHEPYAVQTMLYFKPPGARGQAFHQDQYYLKVQPGTSMAAWMALDDCDEAKGCMQMVAGSQHWDVLCTIPADTTLSFTDVTVPLPPGVKPTAAIMKAGDVLFFNGQIVHGSYPNSTGDRFRRALIGHYIVGEAEKVAQFYHPALRMDGSPVELGASEGGGSCGIWVESAGNPVIEMRGDSKAKSEDHE